MTAYQLDPANKKDAPYVFVSGADGWRSACSDQGCHS